MTDTSSTRPGLAGPSIYRPSPDEAAALVRRRYAAERRFKYVGLAAVILTATFLFTLLGSIFMKGYPAFFEHSVTMDVALDEAIIDPSGRRDPDVLRQADYMKIVRQAVDTAIPGIEGRLPRRALSSLVSVGAGTDLRDRVLADPSLIGTTIKVPLLLSADADLFMKDSSQASTRSKGTALLTPSSMTGEVAITAEGEALKPLYDGLLAAGFEAGDDNAIVLQPRQPSRLIALNGGVVKVERVTPNSASGTVILPLQSADASAAWELISNATPESRRRLSDMHVAFLERFEDVGDINKSFATRFFGSGDSRNPELAGIRGALVGSILTLLITLMITLPIGVLAAIYLEEFAPKNRITDIIEVNINNLAAVPSIVFGLLGLAVFLNYFGLPRSAPLVGGLVLALMTLPTIIIAARAAIKSVPPSIREAAIGVGASHQQAVFHHVLPLAMPGIMTGTIIGMAQALGETAPLLMIGMVAFIVDIPSTFTQAATVLPVQIYLWSDLPEQAFTQRTAAAIVVLLAFLFAMNAAAIWLRSKFERRW
jgi:phosphate transport system permease protein